MVVIQNTDIAQYFARRITPVVSVHNYINHCKELCMCIQHKWIQMKTILQHVWFKNKINLFRFESKADNEQLHRGRI